MMMDGIRLNGVIEVQLVAGGRFSGRVTYWDGETLCLVPQVAAKHEILGCLGWVSIDEEVESWFIDAKSIVAWRYMHVSRIEHKQWLTSKSYASRYNYEGYCKGDTKSKSCEDLDSISHCKLPV